MSLIERDPGVERLKNARNNIAVLKLQFIQLRGRCPEAIILVVEGVDDKSIYSQWVRRVNSKIKPEYYVCKGKYQVLDLLASVERDINGTDKNTYFFIDRDFDDYAGYSEHQRLFMTDKYSVENYLVCSEVLDDVLQVELHCNGFPQVRSDICALFERCYQQFLDETRAINFRIYASKKIPIARKGDFPLRINQIAVVALDSVGAQVRPPEMVVELEREPSDDEIDALRAEFDALHPPHRFRGKFALLFFNRWLDLLSDDHAAAASQNFAAIPPQARARRNELGLGSLAARSPLPTRFTEFMHQI